MLFVSNAAIEEKNLREEAPTSASDLFLRHRLKIVEDLWKEVLQQECGQQLVTLLAELRSGYSPEGQALEASDLAVLQMIEGLDLNDAIRAARAFAVYFQLINIVEQHYEQRGQQQQYRAAYDRPDAAVRSSVFDQDLMPPIADELEGSPHADMLEKSLQQRR